MAAQKVPEGNYVVCSCCSRTQASCSVVLLLGDGTPPHFSAFTIQEGYFNTIPVSQDPLSLQSRAVVLGPRARASQPHFC